MASITLQVDGDTYGGTHARCTLTYTYSVSTTNTAYSYTNGSSVSISKASYYPFTPSDTATTLEYLKRKLNQTSVRMDLDSETFFNTAVDGYTGAAKTVTVPTKTITKSRTHSAYNATFTVYAALPRSSTTSTVSIPARPSYTVSYNANGGSGAPSSQTKWYDETLTLSSTTPSRTGYTFKGWSTSSTATSASYSAGGSYTSNSGTTLYAVWEKTIVEGYVKINGLWKKAPIRVKVNGIWYECKDAYVKVNGTWKQVT